ncbi:MAG TPA: SoxR reducing system RseC family protein [bacterium]|nr:SoxR reducing system RseC family protein [bacterium]HPN45800.1 SoxR reducing system RseC family protein [bacterium]
MTEQGIVIAINKEVATIQMVRGEKCHNCTICDAIGPNYRTLEAVNKPGANIGDHVEVEIKPAHVLLNSFIIFIFPVLLMIIGYFTGNTLFGNNGTSQEAGIAGALLGVIAAFVLVKIIAQTRGDKIIAYISHIITT